MLNRHGAPGYRRAKWTERDFSEWMPRLPPSKKFDDRGAASGYSALEPHEPRCTWGIRDERNQHVECWNFRGSAARTQLAGGAFCGRCCGDEGCGQGDDRPREVG